jgi:hypothetical protein
MSRKTLSPEVFGSSLVVGTAALATSATDGFFYLPTTAGKPTGTPTTQTGTIAEVFDTVNGHRWTYVNGVWGPMRTYGTRIHARVNFR